MDKLMGYQVMREIYEKEREQLKKCMPQIRDNFKKQVVANFGRTFFIYETYHYGLQSALPATLNYITKVGFRYEDYGPGMYIIKPGDGKGALVTAFRDAHSKMNPRDFALMNLIKAFNENKSQQDFYIQVSDYDTKDPIVKCLFEKIMKYHGYHVRWLVSQRVHLAVTDEMKMKAFNDFLRSK
jgi:hypothetical protein